MTVLENVESSKDLRERICREHQNSMLAFSTGKDALLCWLLLRDKIKITPFYLYLVPGLSFVEESISYYEKFFGVKIIQMPHPSLYRMWNNMVFCPPERCGVVEASTLPYFEYTDTWQAVREDCALPENCPCANGVRAADSIVRRISILQNGPENKKTGAWMPVWDWTIGEMLEEFKRQAIKLPVDYWMFGRSFDGLDHRFLKPIKDRYPADYARILEFFPLADLELARAEFAARKKTHDKKRTRPKN